MLTYAARVVEVPVERVVINEVVKYVDKIVEVPGTQFTCFTSTKVQILTLKALRSSRLSTVSSSEQDAQLESAMAELTQLVRQRDEAYEAMGGAEGALALILYGIPTLSC